MVWTLIILGIIALDYATKQWAVSALKYRPARDVIRNFLSFDYAENTGAAFSIFADKASGPRFLRLASLLGSLVFLGLLIFKRSEKSTLWNLALSFLFAGSVGNLIDRFRLGYVVDFIAFQFGNYHFPIFNVADSAITLGVVFLIVELWREA